MAKSIVFPYCEHSDYAFGSPTGWDLNIAKLFSLKGYEVYFGSEFIEQGLKADILFVYNRIDLWPETKDMWESYRRCADKILLGAFDPINPNDIVPVPENCLLITPFRSLGTQCLVLPYAQYETKPEPKFDNKTIGWTIRNAFVGTTPNTSQRVHLDHLRACCRLVKEGYSLVLFSNNVYARFETLPEACNLLNELRASPSVTVVDHLPYSQYISLLNQTSVVIPLTGIGSTTEALKLGSLPLAWNNVVNIYSSFPKARRYDSLTYNEIYDKLFRLLTDEQFYRAEYQTLFDLAGIYDIETALGMLDKVFDRL